MAKVLRKETRRILIAQKILSTIVITATCDAAEAVEWKEIDSLRQARNMRQTRILAVLACGKAEDGGGKAAGTSGTGVRAKPLMERSVGGNHLRAGYGGRSQLFRPSASRVKHTQHFHGIVADAIRDDIGGARDDQFSGAANPAGPTQGRMTAKPLDRPVDCNHDSSRRGRTVARDVFRIGIQVGQGGAQPLNAHDQPTSSRFAARPGQWRNPRDRPLTLPWLFPQSAIC